MQIELLLAQFWGWLTLLMASIYFIRGDVLREVKRLVVESRGFAIGYGIASLILGLISLLLFSGFPRDWRVLVTLFGWAALAKGIIVLVWPELARSTKFETRLRSSRVSLLVAALLALYLLSRSYG